MKNFWVIIITIMCLLPINTTAEVAEYNQEPAQINKLEWTIYKILIDLKGDTVFGEPFTLDNMFYQKQDKKIFVALTGNDKGPQKSTGTQENLDKSLKSITGILKDRLPKFDPQQDLIVSYTIKHFEKNRLEFVQYKNGKFKR